MTLTQLKAISMAQFIRAGSNPIANIDLISDRTLGVVGRTSQLFRCDRRHRLLQLCSLTLSCIKLGLGIIEVSWSSCGYGCALLVEEGGRDLIAFMIKYIVKHYGVHNRVVMRSRGSSWDKILLDEGRFGSTRLAVCVFSHRRISIRIQALPRCMRVSQQP